MSRSHISAIFALFVVIVTIYFSWGGNSAKKAPVKQAADPLQVQVVEIQAKLVVGSLVYFEDESKSGSVNSTQARSWRKMVQDVYCQSALESIDQTLFLERQLVVARYIPCPKLEAEIEKRGIAVGTQSGFFKLLNDALAAEEPKVKKEAQLRIANETKVTFLKFVGGLVVGGSLFFVSVVCLLYYSYRIFKGSLVSTFQESHLPKYLLIETFTAYLLVFLLGSMALSNIVEVMQSNSYQLSRETIMQANLALIFGTLIVLIWPAFWGYDFSDVREAAGLRLGRIRKVLCDILAGPTAYMAAWIPAISLLLIYALVLSLLGVNPSQGAHPIVPSLIESKSTSMLILIILLATVAAPVVEEIMFRGVLYQWMRSYMPAGWSIVLNSLVFAAVHPQGPVGLFPLTCIGVVLCLLREWRGSLIAPMLAHACFNAGTLTLLLVFLR